MTRIHPPIRRALGGGLLLWLAALSCVLAGGPAYAETREDPPEGLPGGKAFFTPYFRVDMERDDNIFFISDDQGPIDDIITVTQAGVGIFIPVRMSNLFLGYDGSTFSYENTDFDNSESHQGTALFELNFSSFSTLTMGLEYTDGVTQRQTINESGDPFRQGIPYDATEWTVEWSRMLSNRPSYRASVSRRERTYSNTDPIPWLSYEGWEAEYEWRQPIYRRGDLIAIYEASRQDQFESGLLLPPADPQRREQYDGLEIGYRGLVGRRQPLIVSLGYARFGYRNVQNGEQPEDFTGLTGQFNWRLPVGGGTRLDVSGRRRAQSSNFNTYYLVNEARVSFERRLREISRLGFVVLYGNNRYGDLTDETALGGGVSNCSDFLRRDRRKQIDSFWEWLIQPRMALRLTAGHNRRESNCEQAEYTSNAVGVSFRLGWFD